MAIKTDPDHYLRILGRMIEEPDYDFARETLAGIRSTISETGRVTGNQIDAIFTIRRGGDRL